MEGLLFGVEPFYVLLAVFSGIGSLFGYLRVIGKKVDKNDKRSWRTERAVMLFIQMEIRIMKKTHPEFATDAEDIEKSVNTVLAETPQ